MTDPTIPYRALLETLPVAAYLCDSEGLITFFNDHAAQLWGRAPALGDHRDRYSGALRLYAGDGSPLPHDRSWMAKALGDGQEYDGEEIVIERPDGSKATALSHVKPIRDSAGRVVGAVNILIDITDRKVAEMSQARLAAIVESSDDAIISKTLEGRIVTWNRGAQRVFGYTTEEAVGKLVTMLIPEERRGEEDVILGRLRRGEPIEHYETVRVTKDGRRIDVSLTVSPIRDGSGRLIGASKVARDVTARRQSEQALVALKDELAGQLADVRRLQEMSIRLSASLETRPIMEETLRTALAVGGADRGMLTLCVGDESRPTVGTAVGFDDGFLKRLDAMPLGGACGTAFLERRRVVVEDVETDPLFVGFRELARDYDFRAVHSLPLLTRSGDCLGTLSIHYREPRRPSDRELHLIDLCVRQAVDCLENARLYEALREADRRKDEFLATLAHELRNPLAPIGNALHILRLSGELTPAGERVREIMERQLNQMVRLVDDLLEVSRITRGKIELRRESVDLAAVVRTAIETCQPQLEAAGHRLAVDLPSEPLLLPADPLRLSQVVGNLLSNAAKYTEAGGRIDVSVRRDGNRAVLVVRDSGIGIPREMLRRVFDMFAQIDKSSRRSQGGLGIGLALAKSLVQMHGGRIEARSEGTGRGSEFIVTLPISADAPVAAEGAKPSTPAAPTIRPLPPRKILVVDDVATAVFTLGKLLEKMGQSVRTASDVKTALEIARAERPDVIISDIAMPEVDGYEFARRLRNEPSLRGAVLVALTGYGQETDRRQTRDAGFDFHLVKPVSLDALRDVLLQAAVVRAAGVV
jgi:PAS domain S-box-containing protein